MNVLESASRLVVERRNEILTLLRRDGRVLSGQLSALFGTSEDTIRRDLRDMAAEGLLRRVHGGALSCSPPIVPVLTRLEQPSALRQGIAVAAVRLIRPGQVVLLDAGSSGVEVALNLPPGLNVKIFTNSLQAAIALSSNPDVSVVLIGGSLNRTSGATGGATALEALSRLQADICLMGVHGLDPEIGFTSCDYEEAAVKRAMINRAADVVALASAEKLGTASPHIVSPASSFSHIVTGADANPNLLADFRRLGIHIIQAER